MRAWLAFLGAATLGWAAALGGFLMGSWAAMLAMPVLYWLGPSSMLHDGMHGSLFASPRLNALAAALGGVHMEPLAWLHQHVIGHLQEHEGLRDDAIQIAQDLGRAELVSLDVVPKLVEATQKNGLTQSVSFHSSKALAG